MNRKLFSLALALFATVSLAYAAANVDGTWNGDLRTLEGGAIPVTVTLKSDGARVTGTYGQGSVKDIAIENGKLSGDALTFSISRKGRDGQPSTINFTGKVEGDSIKLTRREGGNRPGPEVTLTKAK
jgi:hypothetical protein